MISAKRRCSEKNALRADDDLINIRSYTIFILYAKLHQMPN